MSHVYITDPPTSGKVVVRTTHGDIDIELWCKEAPKTCRNFIQLATDGFYDNLIFHRIIKDLLVQTGDPTGDGSGGEDIYDGKSFATEHHSRIKFNYRGRVAMASNNGSQFFITLDKADWLTGKHCIFGKVTGDSIYNVTRMAEIETDKDDRPFDPPKVIRMDVVLSPFSDIVPRPDSKRSQQEAAKKEASAPSKPVLTRAIRAAPQMLSFHDADDDEEEASISVTRAPILSKSGPRAAAPKEISLPELPKQKKMDSRTSALSEIEQEAERLRNEIRASLLQKEELGKSKFDATEHVEKELSELAPDATYMRSLRPAAPSTSAPAASISALETDPNSVLDAYSSNRTKYLARKRERGSRQSETLSRLAKFQSELRQAQKKTTGTAKQEKTTYHGQILEDMDDDVSGEWKTHKLQFSKHIDDSYKGFLQIGSGGDKAQEEDNIVVIDTKLEREGIDKNDDKAIFRSYRDRDRDRRDDYDKYRHRSRSPDSRRDRHRRERSRSPESRGHYSSRRRSRSADRHRRDNPRRGDDHGRRGRSDVSHRERDDDSDYKRRKDEREEDSRRYRYDEI